MRRRPTLATRAFLLSFTPTCVLLAGIFVAINSAIHQRIEQDLRDDLQNRNQLLNRAGAEAARENSLLLTKLTDSAGLKASVGLLSEANRDPALGDQVRATIEAQLAELRQATPYDFLAISNLNGKIVAEVPAANSTGGGDLFLPSKPGLLDRHGILFQLQSVPIEIGGETAVTLTLGRRFDLRHLAAGGEAVLLRGGKIVRSTFPAEETRQLESQLQRSCANPGDSCEALAGGISYVVSVLQQEQIGGGYRLLVFRSLAAPLHAFNRAFVPVLIDVGISGILLVFVCTLITSRSVSRPLSDVAAQLEIGIKAGVLPEKLETGNGVREVDLVASAFNRVASAERRSRNDLMLAKQAAEAANRLKTEFLNNVSHELRTPVNGVMGMTELLLSTSLSEEQAEYAGIVRDSAQSLVSLIDDILDFSELETGRVRLKPAPMRVATLMDDVATAVRARAAAKAVSVDSHYSSALPNILLGEEKRIRQVLMHLCDNALKFTEIGWIRISVECERKNTDDALLTFGIEDTGIGIAQQNLDLVFQSFTQLDGSLTRRRGGTGIGLSITKALVELMGGLIGVRSTPGAGSLFWFSVPVKLSFCSQEDSTRAEAVDAGRS